MMPRPTHRRPEADRNFFLLLACAAGCMASAAAAETPDSRTIGGWTVARSEDGEGCFLTKTYERARATTVLLGLDRDGKNHLSVLNANWSIKPKDRLKLTFRLSKGTYADHFAVGIATDGQQGFVTSFEAKFPDYFAASPTLAIARGTVPVERLDLTGSGAAVAELRRCVAAPASGVAGKARGEAIPRDPFAPDAERKRKK